MGQLITPLGNHLINTVDSVPFSEINSGMIAATLRPYGFQVIDVGHHLSVRLQFGHDAWECACLYLADAQTVWVKAFAKRWWLLTTLGDHDGCFDRFWLAIDQLEATLNTLRFIQGTVGELTVLNSEDSTDQSHD